MSDLHLLVELAALNEDVRNRFIANPEATAREAGITVPEGTRIVVHQDTADELNLVIGGSTEGLTDDAIQLITKAQAEPAFKARLMNDPATTIRAELGPTLPTTFRIIVHENRPGEIHAVLPAAASAEGELSALELESIAGGFGGIGRALRGIANVLKRPPLSKLPSSGNLLDLLNQFYKR